MFLSGISTIIIQRVGRWSSKVFLEYIREQVDSFSLGVSEQMLQFEYFHTLNAAQSPTNTKKDIPNIQHKKGGHQHVTIDHQLFFQHYFQTNL